MLILSVETSTWTGSAALMKNRTLLGEMAVSSKTYHSQRILKMIDLLLKECQVALSEVDLFAVSTGPGSFTGLRVGIATVKGLATGLNKPVKGIPALEAFASQVPFTPYLICPLIPARKNEVYTALYQYQDPFTLVSLKPARQIPLANLLKELEEERAPVHLLGDLPEGAIAKEFETRIYHSPLDRAPRASAIALAAFKKGGENFNEETELIMPEYPSVKVQADGLYL